MSFMEVADYLAAGLSLLVGVQIGRWMRPRVTARPKAVCACGHGYGQHSEDDGCRGQEERAVAWFSSGTPYHWSWVRCTCMRYDGPDPQMIKLVLDD